MNFYQQIVLSITLALISVTSAIVFVCFDTPFSNIFITEYIAILLGELLVGLTFVMLLKKSDMILPYSMATGTISLAYFFFTLIMIFPACLDIQLKYFILIHAIGLVVAIIIYAIFMLGEHNIKEQEVVDNSRLTSKKTFYLQMKSMVDEIRMVFPDNSYLLKDSEKMADNFRFSTGSRQGMENINIDIQNTLFAMRSSVCAKNANEYKQHLEQLKLLYKSREEQEKIS